MRIVVHIGMEKTGTTSIQEFLHINRKNLIEHGVYFLKSPGLRNNRALAAYCMREKRFDGFFLQRDIKNVEGKNKFKNKFIQEFEHEIKSVPSNIHTMICSSEHFHSSLIYNDEISLFKDILTTYFDDISIVSYIRKQVDVAMSLYSTDLKSGGISDFESFIEKKCRPEKIYFNYYEYIKNWENVFERKNIIVRNFEKNLINNDLIDDFISQIDPNLIYCNLNKNIGFLNESMNHFGQVLILLVNRYEKINSTDIFDSERRQYIVKNILKKTKGKGISLRQGQYNSIQSMFEASNELLRKEYFPEKEFLFEKKIIKKDNRMFSKDQEIILNELLELLTFKLIT